MVRVLNDSIRGPITHIKAHQHRGEKAASGDFTPSYTLKHIEREQTPKATIIVRSQIASMAKRVRRQRLAQRTSFDSAVARTPSFGVPALREPRQHRSLVNLYIIICHLEPAQRTRHQFFTSALQRSSLDLSPPYKN